jgi:hypothetical protein
VGAGAGGDRVARRRRQPRRSEQPGRHGRAARAPRAMPQGRAVDSVRRRPGGVAGRAAAALRHHRPRPRSLARPPPRRRPRRRARPFCRRRARCRRVARAALPRAARRRVRGRVGSLRRVLGARVRAGAARHAAEGWGPVHVRAGGKEARGWRRSLTLRLRQVLPAHARRAGGGVAAGGRRGSRRASRDERDPQGLDRGPGLRRRRGGPRVRSAVDAAGGADVAQQVRGRWW